MSVIAAAIKHMMAAGMSSEAICAAVAEMEAAVVTPPPEPREINPLAERLNSKGELVRRKIPKTLRQAVIARDGDICTYCGIKIHPSAIHLDHRLPVSKGGGHTLDNLCVTCQPCNNAKGNRVIMELLP